MSQRLRPITTFTLLTALLASCGIFISRAQAQDIEGQVIASEYGEYQVWASGINRFTFAPTSCQVSGGGSNFSAFTHGLPVRIVDPGNPAIDETVTAGLVDISACSVALAPVNTHIPPFYLTSGTAGLQEAINANLSSLGANTVVLSAEWYRLGGSAAIIGSVTGTNSLRLEDITTTPATWYQWNGSQYVAVSGSGSGATFTPNSIQYATSALTTRAATGTDVNTLLAGLNGCGTSGYVYSPAAGTCIAPPATGITSINGDSTQAQKITGTGGISCSTAAGTTTCSSAGTAGSGAVSTGGPYNDTGYTPSTAGTTVGPLQASLTLPLNLSASQINTVLSAPNIRVQIQNGDAHTPFVNSTYHNPVTDDRSDVPTYKWDVKASGAQCDAVYTTGQFTLGSNVITSHGGATTADIGKVVMVVAPNASGVPTRFISTIASVNSDGEDVLTSTSPFTVNIYNWTYTMGHDDSAALQDALTLGSSGGIEIELPKGNCFSTKTLTYDGGNISGQGVNQSALIGPAGQDTLAAADPSNPGFGSFTSHSHIHDFRIYFDAEIDATKAWQSCVDNGGGAPLCTSQTPLYRPIGIGDADANDPLNYQWITGTGLYNTGAIDGVATTNGTTSITITSSTVPSVGQEIIFPYLSTGLFSTTVSAVTGTMVTLAAAIPASGILTQQEWFAGTSVQNIQTAISSSTVINATNTLTITLANPCIPDPEFSEAGLAPYGAVEIDDEEFTYYGASIYPASTSTTCTITLTSRAQNGTTAANHSIGADIFPLNPLNLSLPWAVVPTLNSGATTPAGAEFFPAAGVGNAAIAFPVANGASCSSGGCGTEAVGQGNWHDLIIQDWPEEVASTTQNLIGYELQNDTAAIYMVPLPFDSRFEHIYIQDPFYGIVEGEPSINTVGYFDTFPTADGNLWDHITVQSAAYPLWTIGEGSSAWKNIQVFSQSGSPPNNVWPGFTPAYSGSQGGWIMGGPYNDQLAPGCCDNSTAMTYTHFDGFYIEAEVTGNPGLALTQPLFQLDCDICTYTSFTPKSGGVTFVGGQNQLFAGGDLAGASNLPIINFGSNNTFERVRDLSTTSNSNTYGVGSFINWGPGTVAFSQNNPLSGNASQFATLAGNSKQPALGQTNETFNTGNITAPYMNSQNGYITPDEFNTNHSLESNPISIGWTFDDTSPISHSYVECIVTEGYSCLSFNFNSEGRIWIGPDQRIPAGPTEMYVSFKTPNATEGAPVQFQISAVGYGSCAGAGLLYNSDLGGGVSAINTTGESWQTFGPFPVNFTGMSGCYLETDIGGYNTAVSLELGFVDFSPLAQNINAQQVTTPAVCQGSTCRIVGSGAPTACGTTYGNGSTYQNTSGTTGSLFYVCNAASKTWVDVY